MDVDEIIARSLSPIRGEIQRLAKARKELSDTEIECTSSDRCITISQTLAGEVLEVRIRAGTFDTYDEAALSQALAELFRSLHKAARQGAQQLRDQIRYEGQESRHG